MESAHCCRERLVPLPSTGCLFYLLAFLVKPAAKISIHCLRLHR
jgi:hypothetical protein